MGVPVCGLRDGSCRGNLSRKRHSYPCQAMHENDGEFPALCWCNISETYPMNTHDMIHRWSVRVMARWHHGNNTRLFCRIMGKLTERKSIEHPIYAHSTTLLPSIPPLLSTSLSTDHSTTQSQCLCRGWLKIPNLPVRHLIFHAWLMVERHCIMIGAFDEDRTIHCGIL